MATNYEFIPSGDTTVTAQWTLASKNDVSDKITFAQAQDTAVYAGPVALNTFVSEASIADIPPAAAFTYTLTKDNLQAIRDILNAYDTLLGSDVSTARVVLRSLVK